MVCSSAILQITPLIGVAFNLIIIRIAARREDSMIPTSQPSYPLHLISPSSQRQQVMGTNIQVDVTTAVETDKDLISSKPATMDWVH
jgi:hypothetical protein